MSDIKLNRILNISKEEYNDWTICLNNAPNNNPGERNNLYSMGLDPKRMMQHISWKKGKNTKNSFRSINTKYCLQFLRLDKDLKWDNWLFMGAFENKGVIKDINGNEIYNLKPLERFSEYREKLIIEFKKKQGPKQAKIKVNLIEDINVLRILEKKYINVERPFNGYNNISFMFTDLKQIIDQNVDNWRELLSNVQCVYVITDISNGKLYIGSTYGYNGIWQRWSTYVNSEGTGGNVVLDELVKFDAKYAYNNFKFTVLELFFNTRTNEKLIKERENYWKDVFVSNKKGCGYNRN